MPRKVVPLITGETYHVYNRGVDKRAVFLDKFDYWRFYKSLQMFNTEEQSGSLYRRKFKQDWLMNQKPIVNINAYCLLNNHFHLLLTQLVDGGISEFMKRLGGGYTSYFNERYERSGALFQGNFKRVHCEDNEQLLYVAAYVNFNNLVHNIKDYFLSSAEAYEGKREESFVKADFILDQYKNRASFVIDARATVQEIARKRKLDKEYNKGTLLE